MTNIFIEGEKINLCIPADSDFDEWSSWFNDQKVTKFLDQGKFPNSTADQKEFYLNAKKASRFISMIKSKEGKLLGVISLSEIDFEKSACQIAIVCPVKCVSAPFAALEAMAIATEHAFKRLGMRRVWAGQAYPSLSRWNQTLEVIGFKTEGFKRGGFVHGWEVSDAVLISIVFDDFASMIRRRGNKLWPGESVSRYLVDGLIKKQSSASRIKSFIDSCHSDNDELIRSLEEGFLE